MLADFLESQGRMLRILLEPTAEPGHAVSPSGDNEPVSPQPKISASAVLG
jgi:hypothetical protein